MALTFNGVAIAIDDSSLPPDYTKPTVTTVAADWTTSQEKLYTITKASVDNADPATMFGNIVTSVSTSVQTDINSAFDTTTSNFTAYATLNKCESDMDRNSLQATISDFYVDVTINVKED